MLDGIRAALKGDQMSKINPRFDKLQQAASFYHFRDRWRRAITISHRLSAADKLVALVLLEHMSRKRWTEGRRFECWPSQNRIGTLIHRTPPNIKKSIKQLVGLGVVALARTGSARTHETALYRFEAGFLDATEAEANTATDLWPDRRLNKPGIGTDTSAGIGTASAGIGNDQGLVSEPIPNLTDRDHKERDHSDSPHRAAARGEDLSPSGNWVVEGQPSAPPSPQPSRPKGRAGRVLDDIKSWSD